MKGERRITLLDFAEYLRKWDVLENHKVLESALQYSYVFYVPFSWRCRLHHLFMISYHFFFIILIFVRNRFLRNSSQIGFLTLETNLDSLTFFKKLKKKKKIRVHCRSESLFSFATNRKHLFLYVKYEKKQKTWQLFREWTKEIECCIIEYLREIRRP